MEDIDLNLKRINGAGLIILETASRCTAHNCRMKTIHEIQS